MSILRKEYLELNMDKPEVGMTAYMQKHNKKKWITMGPSKNVEEITHPTTENNPSTIEEVNALYRIHEWDICIKPLLVKFCLSALFLLSTNKACSFACFRKFKF